MKKIAEHKNRIIARIEHPIDTIFDRYTGNLKDKKTTALKALVTNIAERISSVVDIDIDTLNLKNELDTKILELVE
jgi:excinuclease UvrABC ATPase subunit